MARGRFVTFEGGEGAGKSTQIGRLAARLEALGRRVTATREPGGSPRAEALRDALLSGAAKPFGTFAEAVLFAAARSDHVARTIRPALEAGTTVLCDRFTDSTRVYQGVVGDVPMRDLDSLERVALDGLRPDLTIVLDVPPKLGLARAAHRREKRGEAPDRFEGESAAYHARIREAFLAIASADPGRCRVVDASSAPEIVTERIWAVVADALPDLAGQRPARRDV